MTDVQQKLRTALNLTIEGDEELAAAIKAGPSALMRLWSDEAIYDLAHDTDVGGNLTEWVVGVIAARDAVIEEMATVRGEFMRGVIDETGMSRSEADAQWAGHSRQMSDSARAAVERGGYAEGREVGAEILICQ